MNQELSSEEEIISLREKVASLQRVNRELYYQLLRQVEDKHRSNEIILHENNLLKQYVKLLRNSNHDIHSYLQVTLSKLVGSLKVLQSELNV